MILIVNDYDGLYSKFWSHLGEITTDSELLFRDPNLVKLMCFTGGSDVSPTLYSHENLASSCDPARDQKEVLIFQMARKHELPMTGICRGAQFLNVMCGGTTVQDMGRKGHHGRQECTTRDDQNFDISCDHHQMSVLGPSGIFLGESRQSIPTDTCAYDGDLRELSYDQVRWDCNGRYDLYVTEAFAYPKVNIFAVQHHPEWQDIGEEAPQWTLQKTREICLQEAAQAV